MKKINELELKARVNRLKEYMAEMGRGMPSQQGQATPAAAPAGTTGGKAWPKDPTAIKSFQTANKLTPDGLIGNKTLAALKAQGYTPPGGFVPVANKAAPAKPANAATAPSGTTAPAAGQTFAQNVAANKAAAQLGGAPAPAQPGLPASVPGSVADITKQIVGSPAKPAAPTGDVAKNPVGTTNAATAIPTGGLENSANQAKPAAPAGAAQGMTEPDTPENDLSQFNKNAVPASAANAASATAEPEAGTHEFDPTWGGTKAAPDTRTGMQKVLPNFLGGKSAPVAANQNATWDNAQQRAVSNPPPAAPAVAESVNFKNDELSRIINLVHYR